MNIEEAIKILKELKKNEWGELLNCWDYGAEESKAIETLLTAYEKEKEKNKNKDKIKEIICPSPENPIPIEIQQSEIYKKLLKEVEE